MQIERHFVLGHLPEKNIDRITFLSSWNKEVKGSVTLLVCASLSGQKLPILVIGKYKCHRCLRCIDAESLPCSHNHYNNAWMASSIIRE